MTLDKFFGFKARNTNLRIETLAGATTFLTMAYIVAVNPAILSAAGMPVAAVAAATCVAAGIGCILMGLIANYPLALAPGMGLNAYFAYTVVNGMGVPWQTALGCVFISGVVFLLLTVSGLRQLIVNAIPRPLFSAVAAGVGLFIAFIGLKNAGIVVANEATTVALGNLKTPETALALLGLVVIAALMAWRVRGAMLVGILVTTLAGWLMHLVKFDAPPVSLADMTATAFKLDLPSALGFSGHHGLGVLEIIFVFLFVDLFDNVGTLVAVSKKAGLVEPDGSIKGLNRILLADSFATIAGSMAGTSTVVSYIESASGVEAGGRTGFAAIVTGVLFLLTLLIAPYVQAIPAAATAPALILVGAMMIAPLVEIEWDDPTVAVPSFLTLVMIPLTFSIANGLAFGLTSYAILKALRGQAKPSDWMLFVLGALFIARFVYLSAA